MMSFINLDLYVIAIAILAGHEREESHALTCESAQKLNNGGQCRSGDWKSP